MTDEEILEALDQIKLELHELYLELGIEGPAVQSQMRQRQGGNGGKGGNRDENFVPNGDGIPDETCPLDDVDESGDTA